MASSRRRARALPERRPACRAGLLSLPALVVLGLLAVSLYLRTKSLGESLWMDEGLSIGIASQPLFDIPGVAAGGRLAAALLHAAVRLDGRVRRRARPRPRACRWSIALLAIPGGLWAGWSLFGRRAGLICAALCAVNPFLTNYAQETRMYSLMLVLSLLTTAAFLHVFAFRRRALPAARSWCFLALLVYTHNWGLFMAAGALRRADPVLVRLGGPARASCATRCSASAASALLYLPWVPTLLHQIQHTGAPWLNSPRFGAPVQISKGAARRRHAHRGAAAGRRLGHRGDPPAPGEGQGAHAR